MPIRTPTIPKNIVVHLGKPEDKLASNISVPFPEYIKNVASGEIYPNWPIDAIIANVLAQISFALNRVYNEWYPSRGYNFDITSLPAYDQSFSEDRSFFEKISQIVDEIFNNYIVENTQVQPLFAEYCDGIKTKCKGLSQWGTVKLAKEGKNPLEILKYYYGDNINIIYNAPIEELMESYPGFPLKIGTTGDFVREIKIELNRIGQNYPAITPIIDDSTYFTIDTEAAVKSFQKIFSLPITGTVDKATWYKIKYIYNAVKQISDLYSEGISIPEAELVYKTALEYGDTGEDVRNLNYLLTIVSYFNPNIPYYDLIGSTFDTYTRKVVLEFQKNYNLEPTGVVDINTWKVLTEVYLQTLKDIPSKYLMYLNEFYPGEILIKGMTNNNVTNIQRFIYIICKKFRNIPGIVVNGTFDDLTEESVRAIQRQLGLEITGIIGPSTWYHIVELSKE